MTAPMVAQGNGDALMVGSHNYSYKVGPCLSVDGGFSVGQKITPSAVRAWGLVMT